MQSDATTVTQYLAELPADRRAALEAVRQTILAHLPAGYEEAMNWGMITYQLSKKMATVQPPPVRGRVSLHHLNHGLQRLRGGPAAGRGQLRLRQSSGVLRPQALDPFARLVRTHRMLQDEGDQAGRNDRIRWLDQASQRGQRIDGQRYGVHGQRLIQRLAQHGVRTVQVTCGAHGITQVDLRPHDVPADDKTTKDLQSLTQHGLCARHITLRQGGHPQVTIRGAAAPAVTQGVEEKRRRARSRSSCNHQPPGRIGCGTVGDDPHSPVGTSLASAKLATLQRCVQAA